MVMVMSTALSPPSLVAVTVTMVCRGLSTAAGVPVIWQLLVLRLRPAGRAGITEQLCTGPASLLKSTATIATVATSSSVDREALMFGGGLMTATANSTILEFCTALVVPSVLVARTRKVLVPTDDGVPLTWQVPGAVATVLMVKPSIV